jgi:hypothetical protein
MGRETGMNLEAPIEVAEWMARRLGKSFWGRSAGMGDLEPVAG